MGGLIRGEREVEQPQPLFFFTRTLFITGTLFRSDSCCHLDSFSFGHSSFLLGFFTRDKTKTQMKGNIHWLETVDAAADYVSV